MGSLNNRCEFKLYEGKNHAGEILGNNSDAAHDAATAAAARVTQLSNQVPVVIGGHFNPVGKEHAIHIEFAGYKSPGEQNPVTVSTVIITDPNKQMAAARNGTVYKPERINIDPIELTFVQERNWVRNLGDSISSVFSSSSKPKVEEDAVGDLTRESVDRLNKKLIEIKPELDPDQSLSALDWGRQQDYQHQLREQKKLLAKHPPVEMPKVPNTAPMTAATFTR